MKFHVSRSGPFKAFLSEMDRHLRSLTGQGISAFPKWRYRADWVDHVSPLASAVDCVRESGFMDARA